MSPPGDEAPATGLLIAGRYQIIRQLGAGGMGAVYQAKQLSMDRMVAIKLIHPHIASRPEVAARFHREMQATSRIEHPSTIQVYDYGATDEGQLFLAMELLEGRSLSEVIAKEGPLPPARILHIVRQITRALGAAHAEGIVHRDLKPDNVMLVDRYGEHDVVKVLDFGIARFVGGGELAAQMTAEGALVGTPAYMSPEQALGRSLDFRTDFYSLGVMLYQLAVGKLPFEATTLAGFLMAHAAEEPPVPSVVAPGRIGPGLEALILRLLKKAPADRPATAADLLASLDACEAETVPSAAPHAVTSSVPRMPVQRSRSMRWGWIALAVALVAGGGSVEWARRSRPTWVVQARAELDALLTADGAPAAPAQCRAQDPALIERMTRAARLLDGSKFATPRPRDRDALAELSSPIVADPPAEYLALLAHAKLVVEAKPDAAIADARQAAERCPQFALAHNLVGKAESKAHEEAALAAFQQATVLAPTYLAPRINFGFLAARVKGHGEDALIALDEVLKTNPKEPLATAAKETRVQVCNASDLPKEIAERHCKD